MLLDSQELRQIVASKLHKVDILNRIQMLLEASNGNIPASTGIDTETLPEVEDTHQWLQLEIEEVEN